METKLKFDEFDSKYKSYNNESRYKGVVPSYILEDGSIFYIEPNFYTQLINLKLHYFEEFSKILDSIEEIVRKNKKVIFTGNYDQPLVNIDGFIYRDIGDILAYNKLTLDIKINPESDWKD